MNNKTLCKHEEKKEGFLEEKQERREFLRNLGKAALPAIAFLGLGAFGSKLHGSNDPVGVKNKKSNPSMDCSSGCTGECEGNCKGDCMGGCKGSCDGSCKGDCSGSSKNEVLRGAKSSRKSKN